MTNHSDICDMSDVYPKQQDSPKNEYFASNKTKFSVSPWIEKYRPSKLDEIISHKHVINTFKSYIGGNNFPNTILYGPPGTGKTTIVTACATELFGKNVKLCVLEINASEERGIDVIRSRVSQFVGGKNTFSWDGNVPPIKLIILDEADSMTLDAQLALKNVIDTYIHTSRFCLMCNCIKKIHSQIQSRCIKFRLHPLSKNNMVKRIKTICEIENIPIDEDALNAIVESSNGDMRYAINVLQSIHTAYEYDIDIDKVHKYLNQIQPSEVDNIVELMIDKNILESHKRVQSFLQSNCYSFHELLVLINKKILENVINDDNENDVFNNAIIETMSSQQKYNILSGLGKIEYQLFSGVSIDILITVLIGLFKS